MSRTKLIIGSTIFAAGLAGGSVAASDYPPDAAPETTVVASSGADEQAPQALQRSGGVLAETGSDSGPLVKIAGGAVVAGAGLVVVTRFRRRPAVG